MVERQSIYTCIGYAVIANEVYSVNFMSAVIQIDNILSEYESAIRTDNPEEALSDLLTVQPKYDISKRCPRCLTQEIKDEIGFCLKKNAIKIATGLRKQRILKKDIHQFLLSRGYTISYATVCSYIKNIESRKEKKRAKPLFGCSMSLDALLNLTGVKSFFLLTVSRSSFIWSYSLSGIAMADTPIFLGIRIRLPSWDLTATSLGMYMVSLP